ncbi:transcriptional repressor [Candidatus Peregrinibacteria bacterium]|jgi:Fur family transcriptional regulator, ferric uptake regulator|nr:transcriptional repressor [Candidatus Peregrinibacteria bacterium]MBT4055551.1 transcriptional repressor [Candidatus Peregrinibacteria bacterium]
MQQTRQTKQRKIILEKLRKVHTHPTAEEIFQMVLPLLPKVSLATIYRNLEFLEKQGEILKLEHKNNESKNRYDGHTEPHRHLICKKCGEIVDISCCCCCQMNKKDLAKYGFTVDDGFIEILGLCKKCSHK